MTEYVYMMEYASVHDADQLPKHKKLGKTSASAEMRAQGLSATKGPIFVLALLYWKVPHGTMEKYEAVLHQIAPERRLIGEWFLDDEDDLIDKAIICMRDLGFEPVRLDQDRLHTSEVGQYRAYGGFEKSFAEKIEQAVGVPVTPRHNYCSVRLPHAQMILEPAGSHDYVNVGIKGQHRYVFAKTLKPKYFNKMLDGGKKADWKTVPFYEMLEMIEAVKNFDP